jgi:hypothetical protein
VLFSATGNAAMFQIIALICALEIAPSDCRAETGLDVFYGPVVANEVMCGFHGQAFLAETALPARSPNEYVKIQCVRKPATQQALRLRSEGMSGKR